MEHTFRGTYKVLCCYFCLFYSATSDTQLSRPQGSFITFPVKNFNLFHKVLMTLWTQPKQTANALTVSSTLKSLTDTQTLNTVLNLSINHPPLDEDIVTLLIPSLCPRFNYPVLFTLPSSRLWSWLSTIFGLTSLQSHFSSRIKNHSFDVSPLSKIPTLMRRPCWSPVANRIKIWILRTRSFLIPAIKGC